MTLLPRDVSMIGQQSQLPEPLGERDLEGMIQQRLHGFDKTHGVRQFRVTFERRHVLPTSMNVELVRIANRTERSITEAAGLLPRRSLNFKHGPMYFSVLAGTSMKSCEYEYLHDHFVGREASAGLFSSRVRRPPKRIPLTSPARPPTGPKKNTLVIAASTERSCVFDENSRIRK